MGIISNSSDLFIMNEETSKPMKDNVSLTLKMLDVDAFIKINNLQEVTNPILLKKDIPTSDGLLSYEIFGITTQDRMSRMAYIDLHGYFLKPSPALKLKAYDRRLYNIMMSLTKYKLDSSGDLIEDDIDGKTGPGFLYEIWGKFKIKEKGTLMTKEVEKFFTQPKDNLFTTKLPVIPAFYRDINLQAGDKPSTNRINEIYAGMISYAQLLKTSSDPFGIMTNITSSRVQSLIIDLYTLLVLKEVKGQPSKFGLMRKHYMSKNITYTARLVLSAPRLNTDSIDSMMIKYGYAGVPLAYVCSTFYPFMIHYLKKFFDGLFIRGGKLPISLTDETKLATIEESYDDEFIADAINKYIKSPSSRFNLVPMPKSDVEGNFNLILTGKFRKDLTTTSKYATWTDVLYMVASEVIKDKHVLITRFPLEDYNGQSPFRITILSTLKTMPVMIGENIYEHFPICEGDPANAFLDTLQISNAYLSAYGADYDGDMVGVKPIFSIEGNLSAEKYIMSPAYFLSVDGKNMRTISKEFILAAYMLTKSPTQMRDINLKEPLYKL